MLEDMEWSMWEMWRGESELLKLLGLRIGEQTANLMWDMPSNVKNRAIRTTFQENEMILYQTTFVSRCLPLVASVLGLPRELTRDDL